MEDDTTEGDIWRAHKEDMRKMREDRRAKFRKRLEYLMREKHLRVTFVNEYQFRINQVLDIFPSNKRFHNLKTGKRGGFQDVALLIEHELQESYNVKK